MAKADDIRNVLDGRREFQGPDGNTYYIAAPSGEDIRKGDWEYSKKFNQAILDDVLTQAQMLEILKKKGVLTEDYADRLEQLRSDLTTLVFKLESLEDSKASDEEREKTALEVAKLRDELFKHNQRMNGPLSHTCENMAEDARIEYLTSSIIQRVDGSRVWKSLDAYIKEPNTALAIKSRFEVMLWMSGLESNFLEKTPETLVLRQIQERRLESLLNKEKQKAEQAREIENLELPDSEEKPKRKRGPKKKEAVAAN